MNWSHSRDTTGFLQHKKLFECYCYLIVRANGDSALKQVFLYATYKNDTIGYLKVETDYGDSLLYKYIDSSYAGAMLAGYNQAEQYRFYLA